MQKIAESFAGFFLLALLYPSGRDQATYNWQGQRLCVMPVMMIKNCQENGRKMVGKCDIFAKSARVEIEGEFDCWRFVGFKRRFLTEQYEEKKVHFFILTGKNPPKKELILQLLKFSRLPLYLLYALDINSKK